MDNFIPPVHGPNPEGTVDLRLINFNMRRAVTRIFKDSLQIVYYRATLYYIKMIPKTLRRLLEVVVFLMALILSYAHFHFHVHLTKHHINSTYNYNCLEEVVSIWPKNGILRVEINSNQHKSKNKEEVVFEHSRVGLVENTFQEPHIRKPNLWSTSFINNMNSKGLSYDGYIVEYSLNNDYLSLSSNTRNLLGIPVMVVTLEPTRKKCFGNMASQFLLEYFIGYDELLLSSVRVLSQNGFLRNVKTGKIYTVMKYKPMLIVSDFITSYTFSFMHLLIYIFIISSALLQVVHQFFFLAFLSNYRGYSSYQLHLSARTSLGSYLGLAFVVILHFGMDYLWLYITIIVVVAELYYNILIHCPTTKKHWPKYFYLFVFFFYAYDTRFGGQYRCLVITYMCLFILHSMIYFYHHYELPYVVQQVREMTQQQRQQFQMAGRYFSSRIQNRNT